MTRAKLRMVLAGALLAGVALAFAQPAPTLRAGVVEDERTGIPIHTVLSDEMFPEMWRTREIGASAKPLDEGEAERSVRIAKEQMALYPASVLTDNLRAVYFAREIRFFGLPYGGTNSLDALYLANDGPAKGYTDRYLATSFHHEFSSILLRNFPEQFDLKGWLEANPEGFSYGRGGVEALREGEASTRWSRAQMEDGFLTQYSRASKEEDFNMVAEALFTGGGAFWRAVDAYPRIRQKATVAVKFYHWIDPQFTEEWFRERAESLPDTGRRGDGGQ